jgi:hypothetical protein
MLSIGFLWWMPADEENRPICLCANNMNERFDFSHVNRLRSLWLHHPRRVEASISPEMIPHIRLPLGRYPSRLIIRIGNPSFLREREGLLFRLYNGVTVWTSLAFGYYEPYATSHESFDKDEALHEEVRNATKILMEAIRLSRSGKLPPPGQRIGDPRSK